MTLSIGMLLPWAEAFMIRFRSGRGGAGAGTPGRDVRVLGVSAEQRRTM